MLALPRLPSCNVIGNYHSIYWCAPPISSNRTTGSSHVAYLIDEALQYRLIVDAKSCIFTRESDPSKLYVTALLFVRLIQM
jgi:hypothetical protein